MKVIKVLVLTAVLFLGVNTAMAQSKLGHINVPLLISLMPEAKKADAQLETMAKGFQADFDKMYAEYTNLATKYQNEASKQSEAMNQTRAKEMEDRSQLSSAVQQHCPAGSGKEEKRSLQSYLQKSTGCNRCRG